MNPLAIQLAAAGFADDASDLEKATTPEAERRVLSDALAAIEGAQLVLNRYRKQLGYTDAGTYSCELASLEEALMERLVGLSPEAHTEGRAA